MNKTINVKEEQKLLEGEEQLKIHTERERKANILDLSALQS